MRFINRLPDEASTLLEVVFINGYVSECQHRLHFLILTPSSFCQLKTALQVGLGLSGFVLPVEESSPLKRNFGLPFEVAESIEESLCLVKTCQGTRELHLIAVKNTQP